ncbi:hypothetical protein [Nocardia jiangxiensis]|uniref:hypothetical protein n=1 Tax=Nocardia jiangxiensis TaxID=282685 RepID=UPI0002E46D9B|nr:hypothetical protein [Nocardia jiangxiensis]
MEDEQQLPRTPDEIAEAEKEYFDRIWYHRSLMSEYKLEKAGDAERLAFTRDLAEPHRRCVEEKYGVENLGPYTDFELGMLHGKLSALRWALGMDWDFLDT